MKANNMKAMREVLKECEQWFLADPENIHWAVMYEKCRAALDASPRNCDVGTAEQQYERYRRRCKAQDCCDCPVREKWDFRQTGRESCQLVWAQMPYKEGENK